MTTLLEKQELARSLRVRGVIASHVCRYAEIDSAWVTIENRFAVFERGVEIASYANPRELLRDFPGTLNEETVWAWEGVPPDSDFYSWATIPAEDGARTRENDDW